MDAAIQQIKYPGRTLALILFRYPFDTVAYANL